MRSPVYRNLDKPFQILGLNIVELTVLCCLFVGGGELAAALSVSRVWPFLICSILASALYWMRRSLGERFAWRLIRFLQLPGQTYSRLLVCERLR